jgi:hypothetical protein
MGAGLRSWILRTAFRGAACALLTLILLSATHAIWHPHSANARCAVCAVGSAPQLPSASANLTVRVFTSVERVACLQPAIAVSAESRAERGRAPPA